MKKIAKTATAAEADDALVKKQSAARAPDEEGDALETSEDSEALLVSACRNGDVTAVVESLQSGVDVNALCSSRAAGFRAPALWWASEAGQATCIRALLSRGAGTEVRTQFDAASLVSHETLPGRRAFLTFLAPLLPFQTVDERESTTALHRAAYGGHYESLHLLLSAGASTSAASRQGNSPLHLAGTTPAGIESTVGTHCFARLSDPILVRHCSESGQGGLRDEAAGCWSERFTEKQARRDSTVSGE